MYTLTRPSTNRRKERSNFAPYYVTFPGPNRRQINQHIPERFIEIGGGLLRHCERPPFFLGNEDAMHPSRNQRQRRLFTARNVPPYSGWRIFFHQRGNVTVFDIEAIDNALQLAGSGLKAAEAAVGLAAKAKVLFGSSKVSGDLEHLELRSLVGDLARQVADAQVANGELKIQLMKMREAALETNRLEDEFARYEFWKTPAGDFVQRLKESDGKGEPMHCICPACREKNQKSILQGNQYTKKCHACGARFEFEDTPNSWGTAITRGPGDF